jgi:hypothetical protein
VRRGCTLLVFDLVNTPQHAKGKHDVADVTELLASDTPTLQVRAVEAGSRF